METITLRTGESWILYIRYFYNIGTYKFGNFAFKEVFVD